MWKWTMEMSRGIDHWISTRQQVTRQRYWKEETKSVHHDIHSLTERKSSTHLIDYHFFKNPRSKSNSFNFPSQEVEFHFHFLLCFFSLLSVNDRCIKTDNRWWMLSGQRCIRWRPRRWPMGLWTVPGWGWRTSKACLGHMVDSLCVCFSSCLVSSLSASWPLPVISAPLQLFGMFELIWMLD